MQKIKIIFVLFLMSVLSDTACAHSCRFYFQHPSYQKLQSLLLKAESHLGGSLTFFKNRETEQIVWVLAEPKPRNPSPPILEELALALETEAIPARVLAYTEDSNSFSLALARQAKDLELTKIYRTQREKTLEENILRKMGHDVAAVDLKKNRNALLLFLGTNSVAMFLSNFFHIEISATTFAVTSFITTAAFILYLDRFRNLEKQEIKEKIEHEIKNLTEQQAHLYKDFYSSLLNETIPFFLFILPKELSSKTAKYLHDSGFTQVRYDAESGTFETSGPIYQLKD